MTTSTENRPKQKTHGLVWAIAGIVAVVAFIVIVVAVHAAQHREKVCESQYGFEGYDPAQAKIICHNGG